MTAVLLLGSSAAWAEVPAPAPGAPLGVGVTSWVCLPQSAPSPTTTPSPQGLGTVAMPTTVPSPNGQACAATSYGPPVPSVVGVDALPPVTVATMPPVTASVTGALPVCPLVTSAPWSVATPSPEPVPARQRGADCGLEVEQTGDQFMAVAFGLGVLVLLGVAGFVARWSRPWRG